MLLFLFFNPEDINSQVPFLILRIFTTDFRLVKAGVDLINAYNVFTAVSPICIDCIRKENEPEYF